MAKRNIENQTRRKIILGAAALAVGVPRVSFAQTTPNRLVKFIIAQTPAPRRT